MRSWVPVAAGAAVLSALAIAAALAVGPDPVVQPRRAPKPPPAPPAELPPVDGDPLAWVRLMDSPGLRLARPRRSYTTGAVAAVLLLAATAAAAAGGTLQVAEIAGEVPGLSLPPHKSHRWGGDVDVGYTLEDVYPTPMTTPIDPRWLAIMAAIRPWLDTIGLGRARALELVPWASPATEARELSRLASEASGLPISVWAGHARHAHLRFLRSLAPEALA